jgi:hypothetical protein
MSTLSSIVDVTITAETKNPTQKGFGKPLFMAWHTHYLDLYREYTDLAGLTADLFTTSEAAYLMARAAFSQNPRPERVRIGRMTTAVAHTSTLTVTSAVADTIVRVVITYPDGTAQTVNYTILPAATTTTVATAVAALINAFAGVGAASVGAVITVTADVAGGVFYYTELKLLDFQEITPDANISADIAAISAADDDYYGIAISINSQFNIDEVAAYTEAVRKVFCAQTMDAVELTGARPILDGLDANSYDRTFAIWSGESMDYAACAWMGRMLPTDPGAATWAFKTLAGVTRDVLTPTQESNVETANGNHYQSTAGINITRKGTMSSGEFIDVTIFIDWLVARIQERVFAVLANAPKVPFTDLGVAQIVGEVVAQLKQGITRGGLAADPAPVVTFPLVKDVSPIDRASRFLPDIRFSGNLAGAIHKVKITGTLSV